VFFRRPFVGGDNGVSQPAQTIHRVSTHAPAWGAT